MEGPVRAGGAVAVEADADGGSRAGAKAAEGRSGVADGVSGEARPAGRGGGADRASGRDGASAQGSASAEDAVRGEDRASGTAGRAVVRTLTGEASYYADSLAGRRTASGVPYRPNEMIAAHKTLPFGTLLRVTNLANGRVVEVRVVDRGPYAKGRILDLSRRAAEELGFIRQGHTRVRIEVLEE